MRIQSADGASFIQIEGRTDDGYSVFDISADIEGFKGHNPEVIFTGCEQFLRQLHTFDNERKGNIKLEGTESTCLMLSAFNGSGHIRVDLRLCRYCYQEGHRTVVLAMEGGFVIDSEFANKLFMDLEDLMGDCS